MCCCLNSIFSCFDLCFNSDREKQVFGVVLCYRQSGCCPCYVCINHINELCCGFTCGGHAIDLCLGPHICFNCISAAKNKICLNTDGDKKCIGVVCCKRQFGCCPCTMFDTEEEAMCCGIICFGCRADPCRCFSGLMDDLDNICLKNTKENQIFGVTCFSSQSGCCPCLFCSYKVAAMPFGFTCCGKNVNICCCPAHCCEDQSRKCNPGEYFSLCINCFCSGFFLLCIR